MKFRIVKIIYGGKRYLELQEETHNSITDNHLWSSVTTRLLADEVGAGSGLERALFADLKNEARRYKEYQEWVVENKITEFEV